MSKAQIPSRDEVLENRRREAEQAEALVAIIVAAISDAYVEGESLSVPTEGFEPNAVALAVAEFDESDWVVTPSEDGTALTVLAGKDLADSSVTGPTGPKTPKPPFTPPEPKPIINYPPEPGPNQPVPQPIMPPVIPAPIVPPNDDDPNSPPAPPAVKVPTVSFAVCGNVRRGTTPLETTTLGEALDAVITGKNPIAHRYAAKRDGKSTGETKPSFEACSDREARVVLQMPFHGLVAAADTAFQQHYPLLLTPDAFWTTIVQGLAAHVNADPEKWRSRFVAHEGKATIRIRRDGFIMGSPDNDWAGCFSEFSEGIRQHIGDATHSLILSDFSTTGAIERAVSELALMDTVKSYFDYRVATLCGIPEIILKGSVADWQQLVSKVKALRERYPDLAGWLNYVTPALVELVNAATGHANPRFFESIYKRRSESGGDKINGWLLNFFPFMKDWRDDGKLMVNPLLGKDNDRYSGIFHDRLPGPLSRVPFTWEYFGSEHPYEFLGGMVAVEQDAESLAVCPKFAWAVRATK